MKRTISRGQYIGARTAAESYIGANYSITNGWDNYSANPADYWDSPDWRQFGAPLVRNQHPYRTASGRIVFAPRVLKSAATVGDLRRLARAATALVR